MKRWFETVRLLNGVILALATPALGGTLSGYVRDQNWYAQYQNNPFGVGYYEYAVNANGTNLTGVGGAAATDVYGFFQMNNLPAGSYTVASWDVWWRPAYAFQVNVPASGSAPTVDLRLQATMWGYPAFWDSTGYYEFGQTFIATGPISMIYLRAPYSTTYTLTIREGGPGGARVGVSRSFSGAGDHRLIYGYGDLPTVAGRPYYARIRTSSPSVGGILMQMDPRPDFSDPMPGGCLWLGDGTTLTAYPDRDLGLILMSDDDGLLTNLYTRQSGGTTGGSSVGQTFIARGVNLISAAFWLADPSAPAYVVRVLQNGPGGPPVGTVKRGKPARLGADPEMTVTWTPGECPLTPGQTYYLEVTRDGGGAFNVVYVNASDPYPYGQAYRDGVAMAGTDLAGTIMEEESPGSATRPKVRFLSDPTVPEAGRRADQLTIQWATDVASDSQVEYAPDHPPYTRTNQTAALVTNHSVTLTGLLPNTLYHLRVRSERAGSRPALSRDLVICTRSAGVNLLANPGFEEGSGPSPRSVIPSWVKSGGVDLKASDGTWFGSLKPTNGLWLLQGAVNASSSDGAIYQRVSGIVPGKEYTFSAWLMTWAKERINNQTVDKYDVWNNQNRLIYMRLGIDPTGGTNPAAPSVQWTPRLYSHRRYTNLAKSARAQSTNLTVFVSMKGDGVEWHLYAVDDCVLTEKALPPIQAFETEPVWDSSFEAPPGAVSFAIVAGGQTGNALQAVPSAAGSAARVLVFPVLGQTAYRVSVSMRGPASLTSYSAECAAKAGAFSARDLVENGASWTTVQRFANPGENGNGNVWQSYSAAVFSGVHTQLTVGFKLVSSGSGPPLQWDSLHLEPLGAPMPLWAVRHTASNSLTVTFSGPAEAGAATNLANHTVIRTGDRAALGLTGARWLNPTNLLLLTAAPEPRTDYTLTVSNVVGAGQSGAGPFLNGRVAVRLVHPLVALDGASRWRYHQGGLDLGNAWRNLAYDDRSWPEGAPLFAEETASLPEPIRTSLSVAANKITFYFRTWFELPRVFTNAPLRLRQIIDDGVVYYLNGMELFRSGLTNNPVSFTNLAARTVGDAVEEGPFEVSGAALVPGNNLLAAEVHQASAGSSDVVFGVALEALPLPSQTPEPAAVLNLAFEEATLRLRWMAEHWTLETAAGLDGPWLPLVGLASPVTVTPTNGTRFYRLRP